MTGWNNFASYPAKNPAVIQFRSLSHLMPSRIWEMARAENWSEAFSKLLPRSRRLKIRLKITRQDKLHEICHWNYSIVPFKIRIIEIPLSWQLSSTSRPVMQGTWVVWNRGGKIHHKKLQFQLIGHVARMWEIKVQFNPLLLCDRQKPTYTALRRQRSIS